MPRRRVVRRLFYYQVSRTIAPQVGFADWAFKAVLDAEGLALWLSWTYRVSQWRRFCKEQIRIRACFVRETPTLLWTRCVDGRA